MMMGKAWKVAKRPLVDFLACATSDDIDFGVCAKLEKMLRSGVQKVRQLLFILAGNRDVILAAAPLKKNACLHTTCKNFFFFFAKLSITIFSSFTSD